MGRAYLPENPQPRPRPWRCPTQTKRAGTSGFFVQLDELYKTISVANFFIGDEKAGQSPPTEQMNGTGLNQSKKNEGCSWRSAPGQGVALFLPFTCLPLLHFRSACDQFLQFPRPIAQFDQFRRFYSLFFFCFNKFVLKRLGGLGKEGKAPSTLHHIRQILARGQTKAPIHVLTPPFPGSPRRSPPSSRSQFLSLGHWRIRELARSISEFQAVQTPAAGVSRIGISLPPAGAAVGTGRIPVVDESKQGREERKSRAVPSRPTKGQARSSPRLPSAGVSRIGLSLPPAGASAAVNGSRNPWSSSQRGPTSPSPNLVGGAVKQAANRCTTSNSTKIKRDESGEEEREPIPPQLGQATHLATPEQKIGDKLVPLAGGNCSQQQSVYERSIGLRATNQSTSDYSVYERPIGLRATNEHEFEKLTANCDQSVYERLLGLRATNRSTSDQRARIREANGKLVPLAGAQLQPPTIGLRATNRSTSDKSVYERPIGQRATNRSTSDQRARIREANGKLGQQMQQFEFENGSESNMNPANEGHHDGAQHDENVQDGNDPVASANGEQQKVARANEATRGSNMATGARTNQQGVLPFPSRNLRSVSIPVRTARDRIEKASGTLAARIAEAREVIDQDLTEGEAGYQAARLLAMERGLQEATQIFQGHFEIGMAAAGDEPAGYQDFFYDILTAPLPAATKELQLRNHPTPAELLQIADEHIGDLRTMRRALEDEEEAIARSRLSGSLGTNSHPVGDDPPPLENRNMEEWERSFQAAAKRWQNDEQVVQQHNRRPMGRVATPVMSNLDGIFQRRAKVLSVASMRVTNPAREWVNRNRDEMGAFPPATAHQPALLQPKTEQHQAHVNNDHRERQTYPIRRHIRDKTDHDRNHWRDQTAEVRCMRSAESALAAMKEPEVRTEHKTEHDQTGREVRAGREPFQRAFMVRDSQPTRAQSNGTRREEQYGMNARFAGQSITHSTENKSSGGNWTRVAPNGPTATTERWSCSLCLRSGHRPSKCRAYPTAQARRKRLNEQKRCLRCMCSDHLFKQCQRAVRCNACRKNDHHWLLCWKSISGGQSRSFTESERRANNHATLISGMDLPTHFTAVRGMQNNQDEFKVNAGEQRAFTTFGSRLPAQQMICRVIAAAEEGEDECQTTLLFDPGSHVDCAETPLIQQLGSKPTEKRPLKVQVFGGKKERIRSATYRLRLKRTDGEWESIEVSEVPHICTPIRTELIESGATPESDLRTVTQTTQPQIMIGIRKFWDYVIGFRKIENGAYVIDTVFGQVLCGEGIQTSSGATPAASILTTMPCGKIRQARANEGQQIGEVGRNWKRKRKRRENNSRRIVDRDLHNSPAEFDPKRSGTNEVIKSQAESIGEMDPNQQKQHIGRIVETKGSSEHIRMASGRIRGRPINRIGPLEKAPRNMRETDDRAGQAVHERHEEKRAVETQSEMRDRNAPSAATEDERNEAKRNGKIVENRRREVEAVQPDEKANRQIWNDNSRGNGPHDSNKKYGDATTTEKSAVFGKAAEVPSAAQEEAGNSANPHSAQRQEKKYLGDSSMAPSLLNIPTKFQTNSTKGEVGDRFGADGLRAVQTEEIGYDFPEASFDEQQRTEHERILDDSTERVNDGKDNQGVQAVPVAEPKKSATTRRNRAIWSPERHEPRKRGAIQPRTGMALLIMLISIVGTISGQPSIRSSGMDPNLPFREGPRVPCTTECAEQGVTNVSGRELNKIEICCDGGCWATMPKSTDVNYELPTEKQLHGYPCHDKFWWGSNTPFNTTRRCSTRSCTHNHGNHRTCQSKKRVRKPVATTHGHTDRSFNCHGAPRAIAPGQGVALFLPFTCLPLLHFRSACDQFLQFPRPIAQFDQFRRFYSLFFFCFNKFVLKRLGGLGKEGKAPSTLHHIRQILARGQTKAPIHVLTPPFPGSPRRSPPSSRSQFLSLGHWRIRELARSISEFQAVQTPAAGVSRIGISLPPAGAAVGTGRIPVVDESKQGREERKSRAVPSRPTKGQARSSPRLPSAGVSRIGLSLPPAGASAAVNGSRNPWSSSQRASSKSLYNIQQYQFNFVTPPPSHSRPPLALIGSVSSIRPTRTNGRKGAIPFTAQRAE
ncbi:hypothetical protein niasHT_005508 [Heterodera trifolii]|uniref:Peptidase aspartic putative domain-containing protein n=1 Tax=Heterodera trifolii TaxID=157864 RepID=A0ABD2LSS9_9BILA